MQTQDVTQTLTQIFQELHHEGKTPTVALVKSRLPMNIPMPAIITALKSWQSKKSVPKVEVLASDEESIDKKILNQLEIMQEKIEQLEARIKQLEQR